MATGRSSKEADGTAATRRAQRATAFRVLADERAGWAVGRLKHHESVPPRTAQLIVWIEQCFSSLEAGLAPSALEQRLREAHIFDDIEAQIDALDPSAAFC